MGYRVVLGVVALGTIAFGLGSIVVAVRLLWKGRSGWLTSMRDLRPRPPPCWSAGPDWSFVVVCAIASLIGLVMWAVLIAVGWHFLRRAW